ncbi:MAG: hypothetical protein KKA05_09430 [Alphaproteobacteria bacterium]|nr:hypothetical protein [Alphaproteobacteria bacterium]
MTLEFIATKRQQGQAMAEFVVMTAGCLLLLFVLVPVVAKLSDMSYKAQEAARYTAWERTVWYKTNADEKMLPSQTNLVDGFLASRTDEDVLNSAERRILGFTQTPVPFSPQDIDLQTSENTNRYWRWTHGNGGQAMAAPGSMATSSTLSDSKTPSFAYEVVDVYNSVMGGIAKVVNIFSFGKGDEDFLQIAHPIHNFYSTAVSIPVPMTGSQLGSQPLLGERFNNGLNVAARSAVLADGWIAQTADGTGSHLDQKANDFVLGNLIAENPIVETVQELIGIFEPSIKDFDLGYVNTDPIPDAGVKCNVTTGFCYLDE